MESNYREHILEQEQKLEKPFPPENVSWACGCALEEELKDILEVRKEESHHSKISSPAVINKPQKPGIIGADKL